MEQARVLVQILEELRQQNAMLQSAMNTLREQSRQKDEEIERLRQIILNLQRAQFGQRSEKRTYVLDDGNQQLSLFDTPEKSEESPTRNLRRIRRRKSVSLVIAGRKSARWKSSVRRCLWKRESWICRTMRK